MRSRSWWVRAVAPPAAVAAVIAGVALGSSAAANTSPTLPPKTSDQLLVMMRDGIGTPVHGDVRISSDLGFPSLPTSIAGSTRSTGLLELVSGEHRLRVWENGHGEARTQLLDRLDETDIVVGGGSVWSYTYSTNQATQYRSGTGSSPVTDLLPDHEAARVLSQIGASTQASAAAATRVAGRDAYTLLIEPTSSETTLGRIAIDVDASNGVPLGLRLFAKGAASPALSVAYTSVSFGGIAPSVFRFTPPPGANVSIDNAETAADSSTALAGDATIIGSGWGAIVMLSQPKAQQNKQLLNLVNQMGYRVQGGILISTALVNALFTDDGRLLVGAVPAATLQAAATNPAAAK